MALHKGRCRLSSLLGSMSQLEFAERMEVSEPTVSRWVNGSRQMRFNNAVMAARILNCHAEDLYEWIEDE